MQTIKLSKKERPIVHYPTLKTVLEVEQVLKDAKAPLTRTNIKERLKAKIMHQTLNIILDYLLASNKIIEWNKKIVWTDNQNPEFRKLLEKSTPIEEVFRDLEQKHVYLRKVPQKNERDTSRHSSKRKANSVSDKQRTCKHKTV